ncbi:MAG: alpha/beta hydrolase [Cetobacterium sp.]|uniref:alpha/beta fold hydrolase n=1 Tax=Cetobacterium sp. TaxID=2071632 RepID=UPI002FC6A8CF
MLNIKLSNNEIISYRKIGNGSKVMIMIHGNICSGLHFKPIIPYLPRDYTVYIPDLRGFGQSSYIKKINEIGDLSKDLHEFIKKLKIESFALLGWSAGGCVCLDYASNYPENIDALILIESVGYKGCPVYDPAQVMTISNAINSKDTNFMEELWDKAIYVNKKPDEKDNKEYIEASLNQRNLIEIYRALSTFNISNENNGCSNGNNNIKNIKAPVLLTWGENDCIVSKEEIDETAKALNSKSEVIVLKNSGHSPFLDCPEYLMSKIESFLAN